MRTSGITRTGMTGALLHILGVSETWLIFLTTVPRKKSRKSRQEGLTTGPGIALKNPGLST